jgi:hypothetical protein
VNPSRHFLFSAILVCLAAPTLSAGTPAGILWKVNHLAAATNNLNGVACNGSGRMVAVGDNGTILVSSNSGQSWASVGQPAPFHLGSVTWTGTRWFAAGGLQDETAAIMESPDGANWSTTCLGVPHALFATAANPETAVALGEEETVARSDNFISWRTSTDGGDIFQGCVWTGSQFVAVGKSGLVKTSPNGISWTRRSSGLSSNMRIKSIAWNGSDTLVAVGLNKNSRKPLILTSPDGIRWEKISTANQPNYSLESVAWTGTAFVAVGEKRNILTSANGDSWQRHKAPGDAEALRGVCWNGSRLVAVGTGGAILRTSRARPDSENDWTVVAGTQPSAIRGIASTSVDDITRSVAVGESGIILGTEDDFETIIPQFSGVTVDLAGVSAVDRRAALATRFVAVGAAGTILTSTDAVSWNLETQGNAPDLNAVLWIQYPDPVPAFAVAVGNAGTIYTSPDTHVWSLRLSGTDQNLRGLAMGIAQWTTSVRIIVAVGDNGTIVFSQNGTGWYQALEPNTTESLHAVANLSIGFVAVGANGTILTSLDGSHWTRRPSGTQADLRGITATDDLIIVSGDDGTILTSTDTVEWTPRQSPVRETIHCLSPLPSGTIAAGGGNLLVMTSGSAINFPEWITAQNPPFGQGGPDDDPNHDGISNLLAYGLGIPAVAPSTPEDFARLPQIQPGASGDPMSIRLRPATPPRPDLVWTAESSATLKPNSWTETMALSPGEWCADGAVQTRWSHSRENLFIVFPEPLGTHPRQFVRLRVKLTE